MGFQIINIESKQQWAQWAASVVCGGTGAGGKVVRRGRLNYAIEGKEQEYFLVWAFRFFCSALCTGSKSFLKGGGLVVIRGDRGCKLLGAISIVI